MEVALVSVVTGVLKPVLGKLTALLGDKYKHFKGVRKDIKSLTHELAAMEAFLLKMSEVEYPDVQDNIWMNEVRELSYDMEDAIDDFMLCVDDKDAKPDGFIEKIKSSLEKLGKIKTRHQIVKEIQDLKRQIIEVGERNARYKSREAFSKSINATVDPRALAIFEDVSKLVGIDKPKSEILKILTEEDIRVPMLQQQQAKIVSIVGSGGMGKTTLANQVYQELKRNYDCWAFVSVSRNPNMTNILRTILSEVAKKDYGDTKVGNIQQLIIKITNFLADKRYIVVVDDIWDVKTWDVIKCAFPVATGSVVITTTRINDVAKYCCSSLNSNIYSIRPLNEMHSRQLFHRRLFNSEEDCPSHLKEVSHQILEKCAGLPLAIIAISGLLANKESTSDQWNRVKKAIGCAPERNSTIDEMIKILSLSYFDLPPHLKTCLLYLSTFPEDHIIKRKGLIRRWIAEGFIHEEDGYTRHELGERYFNELINRSLIQPVVLNTFDKVVSCRVHDIILSFIISKSIEENFVTLVGVPNLTMRTQSKSRRISLQVKEEANYILPTNLVLSHVRALNVFGDIVKIPSIREFNHLRVLDFGGCQQLKNHHLLDIGRLFLLRYLNLRETGICELPVQITYLQCLEMLDVRCTRLRELPAAIFNLSKLVDLLTDVGVKFLDGIVRMQALETLKEVGVFDQPFNFLQELGQRQNLKKLFLNFRSDSASANEKGVGECMKAIGSSLQKLGNQNIRSLVIWYGGNFLEGPLCPTTLSLQKLMTYKSAVPHVPDWVGSLVNLQQLRLEVKGLLHNDLCILGGLPTLLILDIIIPTESKGWLKVSGEIGFRYLRMFSYYIPGDGMDLMFAQGSMPKLEKLTIAFDADESEPSIRRGAFDLGIENLPSLTTVTCHVHGDMSRVYSVLRVIGKAASRNPNHPTVYC